MIYVETPLGYTRERQYITNIIFKEFLGIDFHMLQDNRSDVRLFTGDGKELIIPDEMFSTPIERWLKPGSLPTQPLALWDTRQLGLNVNLVSPLIPIIYGEASGIQYNSSMESRARDTGQELRTRIPLDIFGSCFFMLTRYEEVVKPERDNHDRFPARASLAYQENFLDRPIVNEYVEILWAIMKKLWPGLERKKRDFQVVVSHDVDSPFLYAFAPLWPVFRACAGDLIKSADLKKALMRAVTCLSVKTGRIGLDPYYTFDRIMAQSEMRNLKSTFYFLTEKKSCFDGDYCIDHPLIRKLMRRIYQRGHQIGLHGSYTTYKDKDQTKKEFKLLHKACDEEGIVQDSWGGRQHYVRWNAPITWQNCEDAGLTYDTTLSFADRAGFRCGTCYEFSAFNVQTGQTLRLRERPLIVMECSVIDERYMNLGAGEKAFAEVLKLRERCKLFNGDFTLLWHNTRFIDEREVALYQSIMT